MILILTSRIQEHDTNDFITMIRGMILILNTIIQKHDTNDYCHDKGHDTYIKFYNTRA